MTTLALMLLPALELHWMDRARAHELARQVARASWRPPTGAGGRGVGALGGALLVDYAGVVQVHRRVGARAGCWSVSVYFESLNESLSQHSRVAVISDCWRRWSSYSYVDAD